MNDIDPTLVVAFLCITRNSYDDLVSRICDMNVEFGSHAVLSFSPHIPSIEDDVDVDDNDVTGDEADAM